FRPHRVGRGGRVLARAVDDFAEWLLGAARRLHRLSPVRHDQGGPHGLGGQDLQRLWPTRWLRHPARRFRRRVLHPDPVRPLEDVKMDAIPALVDALAHTLKARGLMMATAESCTGGLIAGACTEVSGSSDWFERGFVTYS